MENEKHLISDLIVDFEGDHLIKVTPMDASVGTAHRGVHTMFPEICSKLEAKSASSTHKMWRVRYSSQVATQNCPFLHSDETLKIAFDSLLPYRDPIRELNSVGVLYLTMCRSKVGYIKKKADVDWARANRNSMSQITLSDSFADADYSAISVSKMSEDVIQVDLDEAHRSTCDLTRNALYRLLAQKLSDLDEKGERFRVRYGSQVRYEDFPFLHSRKNLKVAIDSLAPFRDPVQELKNYGQVFLNLVQSRPYYTRT